MFTAGGKSGWLIMYWIYVLLSGKDDGYYVGLSKDIDNRLKEHNAGYVRSTKNRRPFVLVHNEGFATRQEARDRGKYLKSGVGRKF